MRKSGPIISRSGFTIVELLVVIVIIGILAAITVVSYSGITQRAREATLMSDLKNASTLTQIEYFTNGVFPSVFPNAIKHSPDVGMSYSDTGDASTYCINGQISNGENVTYMYIDSSYGSVQSGACSGNVISGSELNIDPNLVLDNSFTTLGEWVGGWWFNSDTAVANVSVRAGTSSDPIPNKPVLVLTNTASRTPNWSVLHGPVDWADLVNGNEYKRSMWIRKTGNFTGDFNNFGVMDDTGNNVTLNSSSAPAATDSWQYITNNSSALKAGTSGNIVYIWLSTNSFTNVGWTLEIQDIRLIDAN